MNEPVSREIARDQQRSAEVHAAADSSKHGPCLNCDALLVGPYCAQCAQAAHVHRSVTAIAHELLHGVFHFEGKFWRTLPKLIVHPGELTRRYINGERAKFVSPTALFLSTVFVMFAVFSLTGARDDREADRMHQAVIEKNNAKLEQLRQRLSYSRLDAAERTRIEQQIDELETWQAWSVGLSSTAGAAEPRAPTATAATRTDQPVLMQVALAKLRENPRLLMYKLKANAYKFSWVLIPLSIPFMWLLFCRRRDVHVYDHAVFVTYSLSFMMLLAIFLSLLGSAGLSKDVLEPMALVAPVHIYRHLRGTYQLSRAAAFVRLVFVLLFAAVILTCFVAVLVFIA